MRVPPDKKLRETAFESALRKQPAILKQLGIPKLRPGQDRAIMNLYGHKDTLCFLPTGMGKSLVYIVPALAHNWKVVIFGPLISLMKDQYESLCRDNLSAGMVHNNQHPTENTHTLMAWEQGDIQFLFVAPERLNQENFWNLMKRVPPDMVAIDECHCASQWADNFRPAYVKIGKFIEFTNPQVVLGLTATATEEVEQDLRRILNLDNANLVCHWPKRANLNFRSDLYENGKGLVRSVNQMPGSTIVYCATKANCEEAAALLQSQLSGRTVGVYHAGFEGTQREITQNRFMNGELDVVVATNAFGMGINKSNIRAIIHRDMPGTIEAICQETGRAGRDGLPSMCTFLWDNRSLDVQEYFVNMTYPPTSLIQRVFYFLQKQSLAEPEIKMTLQNIGDRLGEPNPRVINACMEFLTFSGVIVRTSRGDSPNRIKILQPHPDKALAELQDMVVKHGCPCKDGYLEILWNTLQQTVGKSQATIKTKLTTLHNDGYIKWQMPFKGSTTQVVGNLDNVNFARFDGRRDLAWKRLQEVADFFRTPDEHKHQFLLDYFGRSRKVLEPLFETMVTPEIANGHL